MPEAFRSPALRLQLERDWAGLADRMKGEVGGSSLGNIHLLGGAPASVAVIVVADKRVWNDDIDRRTDWRWDQAVERASDLVEQVP